MSNILQTAALSTFLASSAAAEDNFVPPLKSGDMIHYCKTPEGANIDAGAAIALAQSFRTELADAIQVSKEEVTAAMKGEATETFTQALGKLTPEQIKTLGEKISLLTKIKIENEPTAELIAGIEREQELRKELEALQEVMRTLVYFDKNKVMHAKPVSASEASVREEDVTDVFGKLAKGGAMCPEDVLDYTIDRRGFPSTFESSVIDFRQFIASREATAAQQPTKPQSEAVKPASEEPVDLNAEFLNGLESILDSYGLLQRDAAKAIMVYKAYVDSIQ